MNLAQETIQSLQAMGEGKAEDFAKKVAELAPNSPVSTSKTGKFTKAEVRGNRLTLGLTSALDIEFEFEKDEDLPGSVVVTKASPTGRIATDKLNSMVNQKQFKKPADFLKAVATAVK